jgi:hypothetical protein
MRWVNRGVARDAVVLCKHNSILCVCRTNVFGKAEADWRKEVRIMSTVVDRHELTLTVRKESNPRACADTCRSLRVLAASKVKANDFVFTCYLVLAAVGRLRVQVNTKYYENNNNIGYLKISI